MNNRSKEQRRVRLTPINRFDDFVLSNNARSRGRGRPKGRGKPQGVSQDRGIQTRFLENRRSQTIESNSGLTVNNGIPPTNQQLIGPDHSMPHLVQQHNNGLFDDLESSRSSNFGFDDTEVVCAKYFECTELFLQKLSSKKPFIKDKVLIKCLSYALVKANLGDIDICMDAYENAQEGIISGCKMKMDNNNSRRIASNSTPFL